MAKTIEAWGRVGIILIAGLLLVACNLGQQAPAEPTLPLIGGTVGPLDIPPEQEIQIGPTATPLIQVPPTNTPLPQLLPEEQIQTITIDGTTHRTQEPVTVRVRRGKSVSNLTCSWVLQDTGQTAPLATPTTTQIDPNTFEDVFVFTPQIAGTYAVNCTGIATTLSGQRSVTATGTPFAVEAKG